MPKAKTLVMVFAVALLAIWVANKVPAIGKIVGTVA